MKEFILTQPYANLDEMVNSAEVAVYKEELQQGNVEKYAIVSRIGNRYDLDGNKVEDFAINPYYQTPKEEVVFTYAEITKEDVIEPVENEIMEDTTVKYFEIEKLIDAEVEKAVAEVNAKYEKELALLKEAHAQELAKAKEEVKAELIAKINS